MKNQGGCFPERNKATFTPGTLASIVIMLALSMNAYAQIDCNAVLKSDQYYSASATAPTEIEARANALSILVENISSIVSSTTDLTTRDNKQTYYSVSKATSVLRLKGVSYVTCQKNKKGWTIVAAISKKDLEQSAVEVAARVRQYMELMEQKEASNQDFLPDAYTAYLHTFLSPYAIEYNSPSRHISHVRNYLESFFRTYLSHINLTCTVVRENPDYPDQQLSLTMAMDGTKDTQMRFQVDLPEYGARGFLDHSNNRMDVIMAPDGRQTRFIGTLTLSPPPVEAELKELSDRVHISRDINFEADMSGIVMLDFIAQRQEDGYLLTPKVRHLTIRQFEWLSEGKVISREQSPHISGTLKEITLRVNGSNELTIAKPLDTNLSLPASPVSQSLNVSAMQPPGNLADIAHELSVSAGFPEDAVVFVKSDITGMTFRSSMSAIDRQGYNRNAGRYEIFIKPVKQLLSVESGGFEKSMGIINPQPKDAISFQVYQTVTETATNKGIVSVTSSPTAAIIFVNDIESVYRTPYTLVVPAGFTKISLRKRYYEPTDTVIRVDGNTVTKLAMALRPGAGYSNTDDGLSYLLGRQERDYYLETETDTVVLKARQKQAAFNAEKFKLQRRAAVYYMTGATFLGIGVLYHWLDRMIYETSNESTLAKFGTASYVLGGAGIVAGIINSVKLSHLKKRMSVEPAPASQGIGITYRFK